MRKFISSVLFVCVLTGAFGCGTWWQNFKNDPIAKTQTVVNTVRTVIAISTLIFGDVKKNLPEAYQKEAQEKFDKALVVLNHTIATLQASLAVAAEAKADKPDLGKLIDQVFEAAANLKNLINELKSKQVGGPGAVGASGATSGDLDLSLETMKKSK